MSTFRLFTDGAARGNPGPAGIGALLVDPEGRVVAQVARGIGWATNNAAEYTALIEGLELAREHGVREIEVISDSSLLTQQMTGRFKVKSAGLKPLHKRALEIASQFDRVSFRHVAREKNAEADRLANLGIDEWLQTNPRPTAPESAQRDLF